MFQPNVAAGVHRIEDANVNWYLVEDGDRRTVVDAGVPTSWRSFLAALESLGRRRDRVEALVLTHAHLDHVGFAERARGALHIPVYVHENDAPMTRHPWRYDHERRARSTWSPTHGGCRTSPSSLGTARSSLDRSGRSSASRVERCRFRDHPGSFRPQGTRWATARSPSPTGTA